MHFLLIIRFFFWFRWEWSDVNANGLVWMGMVKIKMD